MKKNLISILDLDLEEIEYLLSRAAALKKQLAQSLNYRPLQGKILGMIFEKPSTRTRVSFQVGMHQLGGEAIVLNWNELQLGRGETINDTARVLSRYVNGMLLRTYSHQSIEEFARSSSVPVINGLSDFLHPCQILSDIFTIIEKIGDYRKIQVSYVGDGNNVANSWVNGAIKMGFNLVLSCPEGHEPHPLILENAMKSAGSRIKIVRDPHLAVEKSDVITTDVWTSMGQESERKKRLSLFKDYQVNDQLMQSAKKDVLVMHCLPAHRGEEITNSVLDGPNSIVIDQSENRLHMQKAILEKLLLAV